ncbi:endo alpha-1,4 polygalactosaminidase [Streptomyces sp. NPDC001228]|uniref:endo alpha-1,4 polygalactosaminidase n=2 Tax=unclassified Streptomyces TaxID=2593676 RepID=UPI00331BED20
MSRRKRSLAVAAVAATAATTALFLQAPHAGAATYAPPPAGGNFDYQIGGPYTPASGVQIVSRDNSVSPAPGVYNICYINAFQTQPEDGVTTTSDGKWAGYLLKINGKNQEDPEWKGEFALDISTAAARNALAAKMDATIDSCAAKGFNAIEPDNYDSYTRFKGLTASEAEAYISLLAQHAHDKGLAIAQKNTVELAADAKSLGLDFAIAEECSAADQGGTDECNEYVNAFGKNVIVIEYTDSGLTAACNEYAGQVSIVERDLNVVPSGQSGYVRKTCSGGSTTPPADTQAPSAPTGLKATTSTSSSISLSWSASTDNVGVSGYDVYRNGQKVGSATGTTYTDSGLTASTTYQYSVKAKDAAGNTSAASNTISQATQSGSTTPPADTQAPSAPTGLKATTSTSSSISLSWTASTDNVGVSGYDVYRNGQKVGSATGTTYTDSGLTASTTYQYSVKAKDAAGNTSAASNTISQATQSGSTGNQGCTATMKQTSTFSGGFNADVVVKNTGSTTTKGWTLTWTWPGGQTISDPWDINFTQSGKSVTATNNSGDAAISAGGSYDAEFEVTGSVPSPFPTVTCTAS